MAKKVTVKEANQHEIDMAVWDQIGDLYTNYEKDIELQQLREKLTNANPGLMDITDGELCQAIHNVFKHSRNIHSIFCSHFTNGKRRGLAVRIKLEVLPSRMEYIQRNSDY